VFSSRTLDLLSAVVHADYANSAETQSRIRDCVS
jgi:hypothetical protein